MSEDGEGSVHCDNHGEQPAAFVCRHLVRWAATAPAPGFHWWLDEGELVALCDACAAEVSETTPWPDQFVDDNMRLVCRICFIDIAVAQGVPREVIESARSAERGDMH